MQTLSIADNDSHTGEHLVGYYNAGGRMKCWGKAGPFGEASGGFCSGRPSVPVRALVRCSWRAPWLHGSWEV
jgi:hypothetical protein